MAKGSAWKSQFLLSAIVFVVGMMATFCFSYFFYAKAEKDWNIRVDQTAERLSNTLLSWLEESYAPVSGLVALVENSNTVEPNEFLNAFESMQSRSTTVLLDEASLLRLNRVGQWQVIISSDALGYPGRYITLADVASTLSLASKRQNQFTLSPPFKSESGRTISAIEGQCERRPPYDNSPQARICSSKTVVPDTIRPGPDRCLSRYCSWLSESRIR